MAKFQKGQSGNPKGRPVGTRILLRTDLLRKFSEILGTEMFTKEEFLRDMKEMEPKDRFAARMKLIEFFVPKAAQVHDVNIKTVGSIEKEINRLAGCEVDEEEVDGEDDSELG